MLDSLQMKKSFFILLLNIFSPLNCSADNLNFELPHSSIEKHFKKVDFKEEGHQQIKKIDFIYVINLDKRPERLQSCIKQLAPYNIYPHRFSAVYGRDLSVEELNGVGLKFQPNMLNNEWVMSVSSSGILEYDFLRESCYGKTIFSRWMSYGAIGCALSHLSILQDAYDAGYETIWVMEDDIDIKENPHQLTDVIEKLDALAEEKGWDILYTDKLRCLEKDLPEKLWWIWRPDCAFNDSPHFRKRTKISNDFIKIGCRAGTYSMIIRRSGIKKILNHVKNHHIFVPIDHEIAFAEDIQLYSLTYNLFTHKLGSSDIHE